MSNVQKAYLLQGGEAGKILDSIDWTQHPLGPVEDWPQSLHTSLGICLASRYPICILWGPQRIYFYNDAYTPIVGSKHPWALAHSYPEVWPEIWEHDIKPLLESVEKTGEASWSDNQMLALQRHGYKEECYFLFSFAPIREEGGVIAGVFTAITETTLQVIGDRRLRSLRELAAHTADAKSAEQACSLAVQVLSRNAYDLPFALFYLNEAGGKGARLVTQFGIPSEHPLAASFIPLAEGSSNPWPLVEVFQRGTPVILHNRPNWIPALPGGHWPEPVHTVMILPLARSGQTEPYGCVVAGVSPRKELDKDYQSFLSLVANQVGSAISNARAYEEERKRAEALAELDRAKTAFFSNVSHEFRTPLTLLLGPIEDLLSRLDPTTRPVERDLTELALRNGLRLLKLVNTLLDFSRLEANRMQAVYEPTDLSTLTADLAGSFRSAIERAGVRLIVDCPPLTEPVYVDRDMWEKIVLNLISNAFKFTHTGTIAVDVSEADEMFNYG